MLVEGTGAFLGGDLSFDAAENYPTSTRREFTPLTSGSAGANDRCSHSNKHRRGARLNPAASLAPRSAAPRSPRELIDAIELRFLLIAAMESPCSRSRPTRYGAD